MINRILTLALCVFLGISFVHAQFIRGYGFKIGGVTANQTWHYISISDLATDHRWGFTAAGFVEFLDIPTFSIVAEIQYSQKGMKISIPVTSASSPDLTGQYLTESPRVDYISIPVLLKIRFSMPIIEPYILAGPRYDILLSSIGSDFNVVLDKFKASDLGATLGVGIDVEPLLPIHLLAEFRYNADFNDSYQTNLLSVRNRSYDFMVGIRF